MRPKSSPWSITRHSNFGQFGKPTYWESLPKIAAPAPLSLRARVWRIMPAALLLFWAAAILLLLAWIF